jgi:hypothetical protein
MINRLLLCVLTALSLSACSSNNRHLQDDSLQFKTLITAEGQKRFEISAAPKPQDILRPTRQTTDTPQSQRSIETHLLNALEQALDTSGFCQNGYLLLGRFAGESLYRLRGECKDLATPADRSKFPNSIERW